MGILLLIVIYCAVILIVILVIVTVILIDKVIILIMTRVCSLLNQHVPVQIPANQMTFTVPLPVDSFMTKQQMIFCI